MENKPFSMDIEVTYSDTLDGLSKDAQIAKLKQENAQWRSLLAHVMLGWKSGIPMPSDLLMFKEGRTHIDERYK